MSSGKQQKDFKKKGQYVPSRYKQAAEKVSILSSHSKERSTFLKSSKDSPGLQLSENVSEASSSSSKLSNSQDCHGMTSTPTSKGEATRPLLLDASAVTDVHGHLQVPHLKERIAPVSADYVKKNFTKKYKSHDETLQSHGRPVLSYKEKRKNDTYSAKIDEAELGLTYTSYLQSAFLASQAKKTLESRSSSATETLHKLYSLVLQHLQKAKSQKCALKIMSSLIEVHEHCQKQQDILKPVFEIIPTLEEKYKNLAEAINATKHNLHVKDIILPECEEDILKMIQKITEFIGGFFRHLPYYKDITNSSDILKNYVGAAELMTEALKRGLSLLTAARDLHLSEASLTLGYENSL